MLKSIAKRIAVPLTDYEYVGQVPEISAEYNKEAEECLKNLDIPVKWIYVGGPEALEMARKYIEINGMVQLDDIPDSERARNQEKVVEDMVRDRIDPNAVNFVTIDTRNTSKSSYTPKYGLHDFFHDYFEQAFYSNEKKIRKAFKEDFADTREMMRYYDGWPDMWDAIMTFIPTSIRKKLPSVSVGQEDSIADLAVLFAYTNGVPCTLQYRARQIDGLKSPIDPTLPALNAVFFDLQTKIFSKIRKMLLSKIGKVVNAGIGTSDVIDDIRTEMMRKQWDEEDKAKSKKKIKMR